MPRKVDQNFIVFFFTKNFEQNPILPFAVYGQTNLNSQVVPVNTDTILYSINIFFFLCLIGIMFISNENRCTSIERRYNFNKYPNKVTTGSSKLYNTYTICRQKWTKIQAKLHCKCRMLALKNYN